MLDFLQVVFIIYEILGVDMGTGERISVFIGEEPEDNPFDKNSVDEKTPIPGNSNGNIVKKPFESKPDVRVNGGNIKSLGVVHSNNSDVKKIHENKTDVKPADDVKNSGLVNSDKGSVKRTRIRKTKNEKIAILIGKRDKIKATLDALNREIEWREKSPEEKRDYIRQLDTHCKIVAGAIALNMYKDKNINFDRETFKAKVLSAAQNIEDDKYFKKVFDE